MSRDNGSDNGVRQAVRSWATGFLPARGPARRLAFLTIVQFTGYGIFLASSAIFFRRTIGLSAAEVGIGFSVAGLAGLLFTVPIGRLADRIGPKRPLLVGYSALVVLFPLYCTVRNFLGFVLLASVISIIEASITPLRAALTFEVFEPDERVRVGAQMRSMLNIGFLAGASIAGVALAVGTRTAFYAVIFTTATLHLCCATLVSRFSGRHGRAAAAASTAAAPAVPAPAAGAPKSGIRDVRFISLALLSGVLEFYQPILTVAMPLWIAARTHVPSSLNAVLIMLDTALVVAFQVVASRGAETAPGSARLLRRSGLYLAVACGIFALTQGAPTVVTVLLLLVGTAVVVLGELSQSAGAMGLALHLPPPGRQGEYQGVFALGRGLQQTAGPFLVTALAVGMGRVGWLVLAALLVLAGLAVPPVARAADRTLPASTPQPEPEPAR